jgi:hypothetical protein
MMPPSARGRRRGCVVSPHNFRNRYVCEVSATEGPQTSVRPAPTALQSEGVAAPQWNLERDCVAWSRAGISFVGAPGEFSVQRIVGVSALKISNHSIWITYNDPGTWSMQVSGVPEPFVFCAPGDRHTGFNDRALEAGQAQRILNWCRALPACRAGGPVHSPSNFSSAHIPNHLLFPAILPPSARLLPCNWIEACAPPRRPNSFSSWPGSVALRW